MTDDIPPDVRAYLDEVARYLRDRNTGAPISVAWARYLAWTGYLLKTCKSPPVSRGPSGGRRSRRIPSAKKSLPGY